MAVVDRLVPMITEVTPLNQRIMRIFHTLGVISLVYAPTGVSEFSVEEAVYAKLQMVVDSCPKGDGILDLVIKYRWYKKSDRPCTCRRSLESCPELQGFRERRVCRNRRQTSRGYHENAAQVS